MFTFFIMTQLNQRWNATNGLNTKVYSAFCNCKSVYEMELTRNISSLKLFDILSVVDVWSRWLFYYSYVIMSAMASRITSITIVYPNVYDQRKHQSCASLAFVRGIHRWPVNSPHKGPVTRKMFPFDDVIMWDHSTLQANLLIAPSKIAKSIDIVF